MLRLDAVARPGPVEPFQTATQRKVLAELGVFALQVLDALLGLRYGFDRVGIAVGDLVGQPLDLALERGDLVAVRLDLRPEQNRPRGPRH